MSNKSHTVVVEENVDSGEMMITIPPEMILELGWTEDDVLEWTEINGQWTLTKLE